MTGRGDLRDEGRYLAVAIATLTRLPAPHFNDYEPQWMGRATAYYPAVGLLVAVLSYAVLAASAGIWPQPIPAVLAVSAAIVITGAFHEDGLADAIDGLVGGQTPAQRLDIMKDSRIGTMGTLALIISFALKVASLAVISHGSALLALALAHMGGRAVSVVGLYAIERAGTGPSKVGMGRPAPHRVAVAAVSALMPLWWCPLPAALAALAIPGLLAAGLLVVARRLTGGQTGDILGAAEQVFETAALLVIAAVL